MSEAAFKQKDWQKAQTHEHLKSPLSTAESNDSLFVWRQISAFTLWQKEIILCVK